VHTFITRSGTHLCDENHRCLFRSSICVGVEISPLHQLRSQKRVVSEIADFANDHRREDSMTYTCKFCQFLLPHDVCQLEGRLKKPKAAFWQTRRTLWQELRKNRQGKTYTRRREPNSSMNQLISPWYWGAPIFQLFRKSHLTRTNTAIVFIGASHLRDLPVHASKQSPTMIRP
jgi:hypothetical protein